MTLSKPAMSAIRFGYGIRPGEPVPDGADALLAQIARGQKETLRFPEEGIKGRWETIGDYQDQMADIPRDREARRLAVRPLRKQVFNLCGRDQHARVAQSVFSPNGFYERLATFWFDHFSVSVRKRRPMYLYTSLYEAEAIRPHLAGTFTDLLRHTITHPAMLTYLDQVKSVGPNSRRGQNSERGLNENLGRELLELHTLGAGSGYTQADVRATSLVLTGLTIDRNNGRTEFRKNLAEPGPIEVKVLGKAYGGGKRSIEDAHAMLADLAAAPQTAPHICRKLAIHFIADTPPEPLVKAMIDAWTTSDGNLTAVYSAMLHHPAAWENPGEKARQPYDYIVTGLRAAGLAESAFAQPVRPDAENNDDDNAMMAITPEMAERRKKRVEKRMDREDMAENRQEQRERQKIRPLANPLTVGAAKKLGQAVWEPPSPEGTEEDFDAWISTSQLTGRIAWAQNVAAKVGSRSEPLVLARTVLLDAARDDTLDVVAQAPSRQAGLSLLLASPEFNRR
ncbi:DUF1800 domain-containing protein [Rhizobium sp. TH2]|uniref:DUF1800 domain-containing protein n=1 Tax=Rhizobium sp. TH2 TaxID=2775403 RepID=UPI002156FF60|nr:DUF1800 domain-containing protein [Rhizobium sp. TH2]UVC11504.1 DUF1800 domain-containing protein [Rhizobium sp. TH2]